MSTSTNNPVQEASQVESGPLTAAFAVAAVALSVGSFVLWQRVFDVIAADNAMTGPSPTHSFGFELAVAFAAVGLIEGALAWSAGRGLLRFATAQRTRLLSAVLAGAALSVAATLAVSLLASAGVLFTGGVGEFSLLGFGAFGCSVAVLAELVPAVGVLGALLLPVSRQGRP